MMKNYYLLYKLTNSEILWIVDIGYNYYSLKKRVKDFRSKYETYYIVSKLIDNDLDIYFKQFTRFHIDKNCELLFQTLK
tara:strand:- start:4486 stop:4722 length:237 start_codon:yes stop_codon:yes gene_type:complete